LHRLVRVGEPEDTAPGIVYLASKNAKFVTGSGLAMQGYRTRRNYNRTPKPAGGMNMSGSTHRFVIQKHDASTLHYDFRIKVDGVLKSWAVPKEPSTDPREKRLALPTEDHPLDYAEFEGVIPEREYGAGTVLVGDTGSYRNPVSTEPCSVLSRRDLDQVAQEASKQ